MIRSSSLILLARLDFITRFLRGSGDNARIVYETSILAVGLIGMGDLMVSFPGGLLLSNGCRFDSTIVLFIMTSRGFGVLGFWGAYIYCRVWR